MNVLCRYQHGRRFMWPRFTLKWFSQCLFTLACAWLLLIAAMPAFGYESAVHQRLTFLAAKQLSRCDQTSELQPLSALGTYVVRANIAQADSNVFWRMFRWNYYNRDAAQSRAALGLSIRDFMTILTA